MSIGAGFMCIVKHKGNLGLFQGPHTHSVLGRKLPSVPHSDNPTYHSAWPITTTAITCTVSLSIPVYFLMISASHISVIVCIKDWFPSQGCVYHCFQYNTCMHYHKWSVFGMWWVWERRLSKNSREINPVSSYVWNPQHECWSDDLCAWNLSVYFLSGILIFTFDSLGWDPDEINQLDLESTAWMLVRWSLIVLGVCFFPVWNVDGFCFHPMGGGGIPIEHCTKIGMSLYITRPSLEKLEEESSGVTWPSHDCH